MSTHHQIPQGSETDKSTSDDTTRRNSSGHSERYPTNEAKAFAFTDYPTNPDGFRRTSQDRPSKQEDRHSEQRAQRSSQEDAAAAAISSVLDSEGISSQLDKSHAGSRQNSLDGVNTEFYSSQHRKRSSLGLGYATASDYRYPRRPSRDGVGAHVFSMQDVKRSSAQDAALTGARWTVQDVARFRSFHTPPQRLSLDTRQLTTQDSERPKRLSHDSAPLGAGAKGFHLQDLKLIPTSGAGLRGTPRGSQDGGRSSAFKQDHKRLSQNAGQPAGLDHRDSRSSRGRPSADGAGSSAFGTLFYTGPSFYMDRDDGKSDSESSDEGKQFDRKWLHDESKRSAARRSGSLLSRNPLFSEAKRADIIGGKDYSGVQQQFQQRGKPSLPSGKDLLSRIGDPDRAGSFQAAPGRGGYRLSQRDSLLSRAKRQSGMSEGHSLPYFLRRDKAKRASTEEPEGDSSAKMEARHGIPAGQRGSIPWDFGEDRGFRARVLSTAMARIESLYLPHSPQSQQPASSDSIHRVFERALPRAHKTEGLSRVRLSLGDEAGAARRGFPSEDKRNSSIRQSSRGRGGKSVHDHKSQEETTVTEMNLAGIRTQGWLLNSLRTANKMDRKRAGHDGTWGAGTLAPAALTMATVARSIMRQQRIVKHMATPMHPLPQLVDHSTAHHRTERAQSFQGMGGFHRLKSKKGPKTIGTRGGTAQTARKSPESSTPGGRPSRAQIGKALKPLRPSVRLSSSRKPSKMKPPSPLSKPAVPAQRSKSKGKVLGGRKSLKLFVASKIEVKRSGTPTEQESKTRSIRSASSGRSRLADGLDGARKIPSSLKARGRSQEETYQTKKLRSVLILDKISTDADRVSSTRVTIVSSKEKPGKRVNEGKSPEEAKLRSTQDKNSRAFDLRGKLDALRFSPDSQLKTGGSQGDDTFEKQGPKRILMADVAPKTSNLTDKANVGQAASALKHTTDTRQGEVSEVRKPLLGATSSEASSHSAKSFQFTSGTESSGTPLSRKAADTPSKTDSHSGTSKPTVPAGADASQSKLSTKNEVTTDLTKEKSSKDSELARKARIPNIPPDPKAQKDASSGETRENQKRDKYSDLAERQEDARSKANARVAMDSDNQKALRRASKVEPTEKSKLEKSRLPEKPSGDKVPKIILESVHPHEVSGGAHGSRKNSVTPHRDSMHPSRLHSAEDPQQKDSDSKSRLKTLFVAASIAASASVENKKPKVIIWPEWNDVDVNGEKWDAAHKGKEDKKGKSPTVQASHFFDDPDGKLDLPSSIRVDSYKRPMDYITEKTPVVVDQDEMTSGFDLITPNEHLHECELFRYIISQITVLWEMHTVKDPLPQAEPPAPGDDPFHTWRPWEHIYALCKASKGPHVPLYNPHGKYIVRLFYMGCWRKIYVDDSLPFDDMGKLLLPATTLSHELWPMLLTKALVKVASLDYAGGSSGCEFGDFSVIHCLTGWLPEAIPVQHSYIREMWGLLKQALPEWTLPEPEPEKPSTGLTPEADKSKEPSTTGDTNEKESAPKESPGKEKAEKADKPPEKSVKDKGKEDKKDGKKDGKEDKKDKKDKDKDKDKDRNKEKSIVEELVLPEKPEIVIFATYCSSPKYPVKVSVLGEMADASERLRQNGLSHIYPHPVWITQTRSCPLEPPPPPEKIPAWKLIRPRKKKETPSDEPKAEPEPPKPIECIEITSPFVNYKVSPVPIPTDTHRPKSSLERGGARSRPTTGTHNTHSIEETDETHVDIPVVETERKEAVTPEVLPPPSTVDLSAGEQSGCAGRPVSGKPNSAGKKRISAPPKDGKQGASQPPSQAQNQGNAKPGRVGSSTGTRNKSAGRSESRQSKVEEPIKKEKSIGEKTQPQSVMDTTLADLSSSMRAVSEEMVEPIHLDLSVKPKKIWMDFDIFCKCFRTVYIFHKTQTYPYNQKHSDLKNVSPPQTATPAAKPDKKPAASTAGVNSAPGKGASHSTPSPTQMTLSGAPAVDEKSPNYLFVDNLNPIEIVVCFAALPRWFELGPVFADSERKSHTNLKKELKDPKDTEKELTLVTTSSVAEGSVIREPSSPPPVTPGTLIAEPYSWKSLITGQPVLRLKTTGIRCAVLMLPAGRHVLRFMMTAPLGYTVHLCSSVPFVFGDEETVMAQLVVESCRFRENAMQVVMSLGKCIQVFGKNKEEFDLAWQELLANHCPYLADKNMSKRQHFQLFNEALYAMLRKTLKDIASPEMAFAWRALNNDTLSFNILGLPSGSRPATSTSAAGAGRGSAKQTKKQPPVDGDGDKAADAWANKEPSPEELVAAVKLQTAWRGYWVRKVQAARTIGTDENTKATEQLQKSWACIENQAEENGLFLFREMFRKDPDIMEKYPFYKDEWNKISYSDYRGSFPDQGPQNWFIIFREIFYVKEETLAVPKLYVPINTCMLRVINNDTWEEIPCVFQKVAPYVYRRNKSGYTFVAEARTTDNPLGAGVWRMRLIGSLSPLPSPKGSDVNSNFSCRELRDYYIPNNKDIIFRYSVRVTEEHLVSLQVNTSRSNVYVKLMILDNEVEILSVVGKGHTVIPAFLFQRTQPYSAGEEDSKRASSRQSNKGGSKTKGKRQESGKSPERVQSAKSSKSDGDPSLEEEKLHKYIIQAVVLNDSWPLSEASWNFVQMLKEMEKNELKVAYKERAVTPPKNEKAPAPAAKATKTKGSKEKAGKSDKDSKGSRPPSQQFDSSKPHWTLRIVSDATTAEDIDVKKDTERADEIRALKKAWEDAEPGRAAKALQSRLKYLNEHTVKLNPSEGESETSGEENVPSQTVSGTSVEGDVPQAPPTPASLPDGDGEANLSLEPPTPPTPKEMLRPVDLTPFVRRTLSEPRFLDESELERQLLQRQAEISEYKAFRERVEQWREQDRQNRNAIKIKQLEQCQLLQAKLDSARDAVNLPREVLRQRFLAAERKREEELAAQEAALRAEQEAKSPRRKSAKDKKSPTGKKKK